MNNVTSFGMIIAAKRKATGINFFNAKTIAILERAVELEQTIIEEIRMPKD